MSRRQTIKDPRTVYMLMYGLGVTFLFTSDVNPDLKLGGAIVGFVVMAALVAWAPNR